MFFLLQSLWKTRGINFVMYRISTLVFYIQSLYYSLFTLFF